MDAAATGAIFARTNEADADGEVVSSWRSDAVVKFVKRFQACHGRRWQPSMVTEESAKEPVKTVAQGRPEYPADPVVLPRAFFAARGPWVSADTRPSLRPLDCKRDMPAASLVRSAQRERGAMSLTLGCLKSHIWNDELRSFVGWARFALPTLPNLARLRCGLADIDPFGR